jgi:transposase
MMRVELLKCVPQDLKRSFGMGPSLNSERVNQGSPNLEVHMAKHNIGIDYHKKFSYVVVKDEKGKVLRSGQIMNTKQDVKNFLAPFKNDSSAVLESCRNWCVMYEWLEDIVDDVVLANPYKVKAIAEAKIKTDKIDATVLADLLRTNLIPECYIAPRAVRDLRTLLRQRIFFVQMRTKVKNRIVTIIDRYPEEVQKWRAVTDQFGKKGREQIETLNLSDMDKAFIARELNFVDIINVFIDEVEEVIADNFKESSSAQLLKTIPGIGQFFAMLIDSEIGTIDRFKTSSKLACYVGVVPSTYSSGGKTHNGRIMNNGNKLLRWAFVEAVVPAIRSDEYLRFEYDELRKRMNWNKAKVAMARRLLNIAFKVLKDKTAYKKLNKVELEYKKLRRSA